MPIHMPETKRRRVLRPLHAILVLLLLAGVGAVYWYNAGQVNLAGEVTDSIVSLSPDISGIFSRIEVQEGQRVDKGQALVRLDAAPLQKRLAEERQKLAQLEALLPLQYARLQNGQPQEESLESRLLRGREAEAAAEQRVQQAAAYEAQASITYNRAVMLASQGKLAVRERDAATAALDAARQATRTAKTEFEQLSQARAGTMAEMRRVKENQTAIGADSLPAGLRIKNYELQRERIRIAEAELEAATVRAPEDGIITEIVAKAGNPATAGTPCLYMAFFDKPITIAAKVTEDAAKKLHLWQQCRLDIVGASDNPYDGYISAFLPKSNAVAGEETKTATPDIRVHITIAEPTGKGSAELVKAAKKDSPALYLLGGAKVDVTVLMRSPLYAQEQRSPARPAGQGAVQQSAAEPAPASAPAVAPTVASEETPALVSPRNSSADAPPKEPPASLAPALSESASRTVPAPSVLPSATLPVPQERPDGPNNPEGRLLPPVHPPTAKTNSSSSAQGLLDSALPLPQLPPMQAPTQVGGSALPDPHNSPSLVTPEILEQEANRER